MKWLHVAAFLVFVFSEVHSMNFLKAAKDCCSRVKEDDERFPALHLFQREVLREARATQSLARERNRSPLCNRSCHMILWGSIYLTIGLGGTAAFIYGVVDDNLVWATLGGLTGLGAAGSGIEKIYSGCMNQPVNSAYSGRVSNFSSLAQGLAAYSAYLRTQEDEDYEGSNEELSSDDSDDAEPNESLRDILKRVVLSKLNCLFNDTTSGDIEDQRE